MLNIEQNLDTKLPGVLRAGPLRRPVFSSLRMLFHEREINRFLEQNDNLQGFAFLDKVLEHLDFSYQISASERKNIPATGRVLIVANHPLGALDALALIQLVSEVRQDVKIIANQLLMNLTPLQNLFLPVDNLNGSTRKEQIRGIYDALKEDQAIIIFPAGEVSRLRPNGIRDGKWHPGFLRIATRACAPLLPVHIKARNSSLFYGMSLIYKPLSALLLVQEMFQQKQRTINFHVGGLIPQNALQGSGVTRKAQSKLLKRHTYRIGKGKTGIFTTEVAIAHPQPRQNIKAELKFAEHLGQTKDDKIIYLVDYTPDSAIIKEIGRLRELSFRKVGEGTGQRRDLDHYDQDYRHLVLWDNEELEIVGAYRIGEAANIYARKGLDGLYTHSLFDLGKGFERCLENSLELGRSFVQPRYWGSRALDYLWQGLGAYVRRYPDTEHLYGPVSISQSMPKDARDMLIYHYSTHYTNPAVKVEPRQPYLLGRHSWNECRDVIKGQDVQADFKALREYLQAFGHTVPTLYKQYTDICEQQGVHFLGFNVDPDFSNCIDGLICVDLKHLKPAKRKRYLDTP